VLLALFLTSGVPLQGAPCRIDFVSHGTFHVVSTPDGDCLQFVDDLGNAWEVTNPRSSWKDGMSGTIQAEFVSERKCSQDIGSPLRVCTFTADFSRNVVGTFIFRQFVECPGYRIRTQTEDYFITNCEDFGEELCTMANVGRRIQAQVLVNTSPSICIDSLTTVVDFRFLQ
jgi:hypothetical protein